jgi:hypothetical protein
MTVDLDEGKKAEVQPGFAAQLQATLNVIPAHTWYAAPSGGLTFVNKRNCGLPSNLLDLDNLALVGEARITSDDEQRFEPRERGDDVFHHAIREVFLLGIARQFWNGRKAMDGLSGSARIGFSAVAGARFC